MNLVHRLLAAGVFGGIAIAATAGFTGPATQNIEVPATPVADITPDQPVTPPPVDDMLSVAEDGGWQSPCVTIASGDTLTEAAGALGMSLGTALERNPEYRNNPHRVFPGDEVCRDTSRQHLPPRDPEPTPEPQPEPAPAEQPASEPAAQPASEPEPEQPEPTTNQAVDDGSFPRDDVSDDRWDRLAECESTSRWNVNTGNGYYGGLQFSPSTWRAFGGHEFASNAHLATREQQILIAERTLAEQGWGAWPACTERFGWN